MAKRDTRTKKVEKVKFGYKVELDSICTYSHREPEEWGSYEEHYQNSFVKIAKGGKYPDVLSDFDFKVGDDVYVVWYEYSTGDSFGRSERACKYAMGVFKDLAPAKELKRAIEGFTKDRTTQSEDHYRFYCKTSDGQEFEEGFASWVGYFESLEGVHIETTEITAE
jgi:hypothetical protein